MKSFSNHFFTPAVAGIWFWAVACFGGNQELVEQKTAELCSINEQVAKQAAPGGLKEGDAVEIKATLRVERCPENGPVVRDLKVGNINVSTASAAVSAERLVPVTGSGKIREPDMAEKNPAAGMPGFRQESLNVPAKKITPEVKSPSLAEK
ncbi:MAG: hypothetical protein WCG03_10925 [Kiritimatiellales bacterium]